MAAQAAAEGLTVYTNYLIASCVALIGVVTLAFFYAMFELRVTRFKLETLAAQNEAEVAKAYERGREDGYNEAHRRYRDTNNFE